MLTTLTGTSGVLVNVNNQLSKKTNTDLQCLPISVV